MLRDCSGALIILHDRYFLDCVVDRIVELRNGRLHEYVGNDRDDLAAKSGKSSK